MNHANPSTRRLRTGLLSLIGATALLPAMAMAPATADEPQPATTPPAGTPAASVEDEHVVTLVTGDVVTLTTLDDGQQVADVDRPDGATGGVRVQHDADDIYVIPDEALSLIATDRIDRQLFNVTDLVEMGYDDASTDTVPVIVTYAPTPFSLAAPEEPTGSTTTLTLDSIGGAALEADKDQARAFWADLTGDDDTTGSGDPGASTFAASAQVGKLWLDGRVEATLDESVPHVGAPEAWDAGYDGDGATVAVLDTGIDASHPDVADRITEAVSFIPDEDVADVNGHGTHVASTVAGTGEASGGDYTGVAPGADLLIGKVLADDGFGQDSWVLAGMEWAAESGADVVNMSLGDDAPSDGTDPMSLTVDALTEQYDTLFVVAAGNAGAGVPLGSPSAAASALTVGATDSSDFVAWFSSQGPVYRSGAIKPDIVAPGVGITAAASGHIPDNTEDYTSLDGTSMATPHVAGAAAILAQQHPDWSATQLKDALMSDTGEVQDWYTPYEAGTGLLDVAATTSATVHATGQVFHGNFDWPHEPGDAPVDRTVTFTSSGDADVTLDLAVDGSGPFTLDTDRVSVPAGGTAEVTVTADPTAVTSGTFTAYLIGSDPATGEPVTRTSIAMLKEDERYDLAIKLSDRDGEPASASVAVQQAGDQWATLYEVHGERELRLPPGNYTVWSAIDVRGERPDSLGVALMVDPETVLDSRDAEVHLDAREARLVDATAPRRSEDRQQRLDFLRTDGNGLSVSDTLLLPVTHEDMYVTPTEPVSEGTFEFGARWRTGEPRLTVRSFGLVEVPVLEQAGSTLAEGFDLMRAVYADDGAPADYEGLDADGKAVVVDRSEDVSPSDRAAAAADAGAALLLVVNDAPGRLSEYVGETSIPVASVNRDAGEKLVSVAKTGWLAFTVHQEPYADYLYDLTQRHQGQVPDEDLTYRPRHSDLARIDARYTGAAGEVEGSGFRYDLREGYFPAGVGFREIQAYPDTRTEWVTPDPSWHESHFQGIWEERSHHDTYSADARTVLEWFTPLVRPAFSRGYFGPGRFQDYLTVNIQPWSGSGPLEIGGTKDWGAVPTSLALYQGDDLIRRNDFSADLQYVQVPSETLPYRLVLDASRPAEDWRLSTSVHSEWEFVSGTNDADGFVTFPLLQLDYDVRTDLQGDVKARKSQWITLDAHMQAGATGGGTVTGVTLEVSYDEGETWQPVDLSERRDGTWRGRLTNESEPGEFVSLRASAATDAGWRIEQEIIRAYGLK